MSPSPVGHCVWCGDVVYGPHADRPEPAHPCCAQWIGNWGHQRCVACSASRAARRERRDRHDRDHRKTPDPMCEHCQPASEAAA